MVTPDGPPDTLPPRVVCPVCRARVWTVTLPGDPRPRYCGHLATTGRVNSTCTQGGEVVPIEPPHKEP